MANYYEAVTKFKTEVLDVKTHPPANTIPPNLDNAFARYSEELNFATNPSRDPDGAIEQGISVLARATLGILPNRLERFRGQVPDEAIDGDMPLTISAWYSLFRLAGDAEVLAELVQENAPQIVDRNNLYWILATNYKYNPVAMLEDMKRGELKPLDEGI